MHLRLLRLDTNVLFAIRRTFPLSGGQRQALRVKGWGKVRAARRALRHRR